MSGDSSLRRRAPVRFDNAAQISFVSREASVVALSGRRGRGSPRLVRGLLNVPPVMTTIRKGKSPITLINVFDVDPQKQDELVSLLNEATIGVMRRVPGFVSANIHRSLDGKRVVNYAQWESKEHFEQMPRFPGAKEHMEQAARLAQHVSPALYEVAETHDRPA